MINTYEIFLVDQYVPGWSHRTRFCGFSAFNLTFNEDKMVVSPNFFAQSIVETKKAIMDDYLDWFEILFNSSENDVQGNLRENMIEWRFPKSVPLVDGFNEEFKNLRPLNHQNIRVWNSYSEESLLEYGLLKLSERMFNNPLAGLEID